MNNVTPGNIREHIKETKQLLHRYSKHPIRRKQLTNDLNNLLAIKNLFDAADKL